MSMGPGPTSCPAKRLAREKASFACAVSSAIATLESSTNDAGAPSFKRCIVKRAKAAIDACSIRAMSVHAAASTARSAPVAREVSGSMSSAVQSARRSVRARRASMPTKKGLPTAHVRGAQTRLPFWMVHCAERGQSVSPPHWSVGDWQPKFELGHPGDGV
jgi:hypothetical protein